MKRATLSATVTLPAAVGTLSLRPVTVRLEPAEVGEGLVVAREDTGQRWAVGLEHLVPQTNCTAIGDGTGSVAFLEHLLACLWAGRISDALIVTDGPELPLYDGSASALWQAVQEAGRAESGEELEPIVVSEPAYLVADQQSLVALPARDYSFTYVLDHPHPMIGRQWAACDAACDFGREVAPARTFATAEQLQATRGVKPGPEVEALCVVVYQDRVSEQPPVPQPFARHKLLDLLGDMYLCGRPVLGQVVALRTGHEDNHALLRQLVDGVCH